MHTVFAFLCFVVVIHWLIFPYPSGLLHWHCGNLTIAPVPAKQPWWIWINTSCEFIMNDCITTTKQSTTKPCAYFLGYTVYERFGMCGSQFHAVKHIHRMISKIKISGVEYSVPKTSDFIPSHDEPSIPNPIQNDCILPISWRRLLASLRCPVTRGYVYYIDNCRFLPAMG